ncbi:LysR family transcriptional regulator [Streptomyces sp. NPDC052301]|uniref:LysR family transcriptional regulator n=1 Tax=Streptomyces sp. NPDC052301 TaxID=3365687 RepID=UPI0037D6E0E4
MTWDTDRPKLPLPQLHAFVVLAEELHFGHAAARLGIAQPPLSQQIRRLEEKVGHALFDRGPGRVTLTPAGRALLPAARRALTGLADGLARARAVGSGRAGRLRIGFAASVALTLLPGVLRDFRQRFPDARLDIHEMTTAPQLDALRDRTIDVGLLREPPPPPDEPELDFRTVLSEPFVAVLPAAHPLAAQRAVRIAELADEPFVLLPRVVGPRLHDQITGLCEAAGFTPRIAQHAVEWQTVCALVEAGLGVSLAPASIRRIRLRGVTFRRIDPGTARTRVAVAWRRDDRNPLIGALLATLGQGAEAAGGAGRAAETASLPQPSLTDTPRGRMRGVP